MKPDRPAGRHDFTCHRSAFFQVPRIFIPIPGKEFLERLAELQELNDTAGMLGIAEEHLPAVESQLSAAEYVKVVGTSLEYAAMCECREGGSLALDARRGGG